jgi:tetratricopeptide (TPR) repeat protein
MPTKDWFRNESWNDEIREAFFKRLHRSRSNKAQYLRIQAHHLAKKHPDAASELLDLIFSEYPEKMELSAAYLQRAELAINKRQLSEAIKWLRMALQHQRLYPNVITNAHLVFGKLVIENKVKELFEEAKSVLAKYEQHNAFPIQLYESYGIAAIIASEEGNKSAASELASKALENAEKKESGFGNHRLLGLVNDKSTDFHKKLLKIIN